MDFRIPDKPSIKREEVMKITRLDGKVIDYWEKEFGGFKATTDKEGEKFYTRQDVETILQIKRLFIEERREKEEIRRIVGADSKHGETPLVPDQDPNRPEILQIVKTKLTEILTLLEKNDTK